MYLIFDTETSNLVSKDLPPDHPQQAHLVELGAILCDKNGVERSVVSMIVRPDGWTISPGAAAVHGITQDIALQYGLDIYVVVQTFTCLLDKADVALAFNMSFDKDVISLERIRLGEARPVEWPVKTTLGCVMELAKNTLRIPPTVAMKRAGRNGFKNPNLGEAYVKLFDEEMTGAHSALADARAAKRVWFKIMGKGEPGRCDSWGRLSGSRE